MTYLPRLDPAATRLTTRADHETLLKVFLDSRMCNEPRTVT